MKCKSINSTSQSPVLNKVKWFITNIKVTRRTEAYIGCLITLYGPEVTRILLCFKSGIIFRLLSRIVHNAHNIVKTPIAIPVRMAILFGIIGPVAPIKTINSTWIAT